MAVWIHLTGGGAHRAHRFDQPEDVIDILNEAAATDQIRFLRITDRTDGRGDSFVSIPSIVAVTQA
jgi:hypothetical protein